MKAAFLVGLGFMASHSAHAQTAPNKFGYFDLDYMVSLMPGVERVDSLLQVFQRDSLNPEYQYELEELQRNDSTLKADSAKMPARLYQQRQQEQAQRFYKLQNWQQYSQQVMQAKQAELLEPTYKKVFDAYKKVKEEGKYTYIFKQDSLFDAPPGDNLVPLVAKKLGVKLPANAEQPGVR